MNEKVFISYRRSDTAQFAARLRDTLAHRFPDQVFLDIDGIATGDDFVSIIEKNLSAAVALLVVVGDRWLDGSVSGAKLGDASDYVTLELKTALRLGIAVIPVLTDGAKLPRDVDIPVEFHPFLRFNSVEIRHASFTRDCEPIIECLYRVLALTPPTPLEKFVESLSSKISMGNSFLVFDERVRAFHAVWTFIAGIGAALFAVLFIGIGEQIDTTMIMSHFVAVYPGVIGMNSRRKRKYAIFGLMLLGLAFLSHLVAAIIRNSWI